MNIPILVAGMVFIRPIQVAGCFVKTCSGCLYAFEQTYCYLVTGFVLNRPVLCKGMVLNSNTMVTGTVLNRPVLVTGMV